LSNANVRVTLAPGEHKKDISIPLTPAISLSGKLLDDDGDPLPDCVVQAMRYFYQGGKRELRQMNGVQADDHGEYRINLAAGGYYLKAVCRQPIRGPRPFAPKDAAVDVREETYADVFYPGSADAAGATRLKPAPGAELHDIDFRMRKLRAVSIRGKISRPEGADSHQFIQVLAIPKNSSGANTRRAAGVSGSQFEIHGLFPGSYTLVASSYYDPQEPLYGQTDIEVGDTSINNAAIALNAGVALAGTVETETPPAGQTPPASLQTQRISLHSAGPAPRFQTPTSEVTKDGQFSLPGVTPGDWTLSCEPRLAGTYIKSVRLGDQEISAERFTIPPGGAGPLKIVMGANPGELDGTVQLDHPQPGQILVVAAPSAAAQAGWQRSRQAFTDAVGHFSFPSLAPGRYRILAIEGASAVQQLSGLLASLGEEITLEEGQHVTKQIELIPQSVIADALRELDN